MVAEPRHGLMPGQRVSAGCHYAPFLFQDKPGRSVTARSSPLDTKAPARNRVSRTFAHFG